VEEIWGPDSMLRVLTVLLALCCPAHSEESSPRESQSKAEAAQADGQHGGGPKQLTLPANSASPTIININSGKHSDHESRCAKPNGWKEWPAYAWCKTDAWLDAERTIAIFTIILAISTTLLWLATRKLWLAGERQMDLIKQNAVKQSADMLDSLYASRALASAAADSVVAARHANEIARIGTEKQLRAYLSILKARIQNVAAGERPRVSFKVKNMGQTPANKLSAHVHIGFGQFPMPKGANVNAPPNPDEISRVDLAPKMRVAHGVTMGHPLTESQFNQINDGKAAIYIVANLEFTDAFSRKWIQHLRLMYSWRALHSGSDKLEVCEEGNGIEEITKSA
jgi:hypothetical protein